MKRASVPTAIFLAASLIAASDAPGDDASGIAGKRRGDALHNGQVNGLLADQAGKPLPIANAFVFLCDAKTGYPLIAETKQLLSASSIQGIDKLWYARTDGRGRFRFQGVPAGRYRFVAQSWPDLKAIPTPKSDASTVVRLHGAADHVPVGDGQPAEVVLKRLGNGVLKITNDPKEEHAFLIISRRAMRGDPVLGPLGWGKPFLTGAIGLTLMEEPYVTIEGLPAGKDIHIGLFNYDNNPGIGGGTYRVGREKEVRLPIYATWSNGKYDPPPRLLKLVEHLETRKLTLAELMGRTRRDLKFEKLYRLLSEDPNRKVKVEGLGEYRLADVIAADNYRRLRAHHRARRTAR